MKLPHPRFILLLLLQPLFFLMAFAVWIYGPMTGTERFFPYDESRFGYAMSWRIFVCGVDFVCLGAWSWILAYRKRKQMGAALRTMPLGELTAAVSSFGLFLFRFVVLSDFQYKYSPPTLASLMAVCLLPLSWATLRAKTKFCPAGG